MVRSVVLVHPYLFALLLAVVELTVGLLALIGLASRVAAAGGLALSLLFFLTASWHVRPFFYGADLPFAVCWLALLLANPSDLPGLDRRLLQRARAEAEAKSDTAPDASRRAFLAGLAQAGRIALGVLVTSASIVPLVGASPSTSTAGARDRRAGRQRVRPGLSLFSCTADKPELARTAGCVRSRVAGRSGEGDSGWPGARWGSLRVRSWTPCGSGAGG